MKMCERVTESVCIVGRESVCVCVREREKERENEKLHVSERKEEGEEERGGCIGDGKVEDPQHAENALVSKWCKPTHPSPERARRRWAGRGACPSVSVQRVLVFVSVCLFSKRLAPLS
jgi:hypothetical protein